MTPLPSAAVSSFARAPLPPLARWGSRPRVSSLPAPVGAQAPPALSFEFFPPRTEALDRQLWACIGRLAPLQPRFVSVTYGAGGSTQERTLAVIQRLLAETTLTPAVHLTCVGASCGEVDELARRYWDMGIRHIVALRGDMPGGGTYEPRPDGYAYAADLVAGLRRVADFEISVAAYPETHPAAISPKADLDNLKRKLDAGATRAITQYFFEAEVYLRFMDRALACGIAAPVVPGIMPVSNFAQAVKFSASCGTSVPNWLGPLFDGLDEDGETRRMIGAHVAAEQVRVLQANGIDEFHFYTLNRPEMVFTISRVLGVRPILQG